MLAQLLEKRGVGARIEGTAALSMSNVVPTDGVAMVCLSYLDTTSPAHMRYMIGARGASGPMPGSFSAAGWPMGMLRHLRRR